ncbi:DUF4350 domain-containing protein [Pontibacter cellulosilyticus]|uniref:DUF4350 domain-containing protein n=1 Tax=Pontibacter cellulosilyticus TaxID=1720253 RepID=A0A923N989_9BACT|nr:DUF4350 domain-containing protein [Pontibacter cellulosilyticus]MBC5994549.1 DUF4350 domain-containing protein [Pontibacter cellulosilyticus]
MKGYRSYIALIVVLFGALVLLEYLRPKPVDWTHSYSRVDKIPFGTYALYELMPGIFPGKPVQEVREPIYNLLQSDKINGNYVFINSYFEADSVDTNALLDFVDRGNQVFIAAEGFSVFLADTLQFETEDLGSTSPDSTSIYFTSQPKRKVYTYPKNIEPTYLLANKKAGHVVLGRNRAGYINFIKVPFGKGWFYINTAPLAFTNYQLITLKQSEYAATALSHLPVQPVYWDEYQKVGRVEDQSVFRVLMRHEPLTWAYYVALASMILFLLFKSKRTQRVIPVIEPPRNTTLDFVKAISSLYFNNGDHKNIAEKKIAYFMEHLRLHHHITTNTWNEELQEKIVAKTGADEALIANIFNLVNSIWQSNSIGAQTLIMLNNYLEDFYRQTAIKPKAHA